MSCQGRATWWWWWWLLRRPKWPTNVRNSVRYHNMTVITPFEVIRDHQFRYQWKAVCNYLSVSITVTYCTVSEIWRMVQFPLSTGGGISLCTRSRWTPKFRTVKSASPRNENIPLSLYCTVWSVFRYLEPLWRDYQQCDIQTDRRTDRRTDGWTDTHSDRKKATLHYYYVARPMTLPITLAPAKAKVEFRHEKLKFGDKF